MRFSKRRNPLLALLTIAWVFLGSHFASNGLGSQMIAWGSSCCGQTNIPPDLTNVVSIAMGANHSIGLRADGTVVSWGANSDGQTNVPAGLTNIVAIAGGGDHTLALRADGTVTTWGGGWGWLPPNLSNVVSIAAGSIHSLVAKADGTVFAWGANYQHQTEVPVGLSNALTVIAQSRGTHSMALKEDRTAISWGAIVSVPAELTNIISLAAGDEHSLALMADGLVAAWGWPVQGNLTIPQDLTNAIGITAGSRSSLALKNDGTLAVWGDTWSWDLTNMASRLTNVIAIAASGWTCLALMGERQPRLITQPADCLALTGGSARFCSFAPQGIGAPPVSYQWQHNGMNIPGANKPILLLNNLQATNAGRYSLLISNAFGMTNSVTALLTVQEPSIPKFVSGGITRGVDGRVDLSFTGQAGLHIDIQCSTNLSDWVALTNITVSPGTNHHVDVSANSSRRFYRLLQLP